MNDHPLHPQSRPTATDSGGFSPARLARMHAALRRHVESGMLPGLVALVYHRGREHVEVIGAEAFGSSVPIKRDTIFRLASMTKPITAVGAMILVEECRIRLDDPVDEWLTELQDRQVLRTIESPLDDTVPAKRPITLRDLLTFRSGYGELSFLSPMCPLQRAMSQARLTLAEWPFTVTPDEFMKRLGSLPLAHQPGERWLYHTAAEVLSVLIARITGQSLASFLHERIFEPLGMKDTGFQVPAGKLDRLPACYGRDFASGEIVILHEARDGHFGRPPVFESGGGGLVSTGDDLVAFGRMMMHKRGARTRAKPHFETLGAGQQYQDDGLPVRTRPGHPGDERRGPGGGRLSLRVGSWLHVCHRDAGRGTSRKPPRRQPDDHDEHHRTGDRAVPRATELDDPRRQARADRGRAADGSTGRRRGEGYRRIEG